MSKVTSLSSQLKRLQVPQTHLLNSYSDLHRVSFLYDPKEAANLDAEAVYSLAMNGLEQLKVIDAETFESFETTLFSSTSVQFERAVQTKQSNEKLNEEIRRFLIHLSPYFMLKPAHKAFEWLVYRYQIHNYNLNEIFMCILPYHETNYFVRAIQMINLETNSIGVKNYQLWNWLLSNQKEGVPLATTSLATHLYSDLSFFNFLIDYLNECLSHFSGDNNSSNQHWVNSLDFVISFVTKTLLQSIKQLSLNSNSSNSSKTTKQQESFLAQLLPVLFKGFKSHQIAYKQSSYLVCSFLFEKFKFNIETSNKTLFALSKGLSTFRLDKNNNDDNEENDDDNDDENSKTKRNDTSQLDYNDESIDCIKSALLTICLIVQSQYQTYNNENTIDSTSSTMNGHTNDYNRLQNSSELLGNDKKMLMSRNFLKKIIKNFSLPKQVDLIVKYLDELNETYQIEKFLHCFFNRLLIDLIDFDKDNTTGLSNFDINLNSINSKIDQATIDEQEKENDELNL
jgi:hypothetical protein